jgi:phosphoesterase RecJ-like protein
VTIDLAPFASAVPDGVVERLRAARHVLAIGHENPDADALGASLAVAAIARALGNRADVVASAPPPALYDFLAGIAAVRTDPDPDARYDLAVVVDGATPERVGSVRDRHRALFDTIPIVVVDHHVSNDRVGPDDWIDPGAAATCEMVALLANRLGVPFDEGDGALAAALMAGIVMDTATFAHPNATPRTLAVAAALVEAGAPLSEISRRLYRTKPDAQLRLFGRVLDRLATEVDGRIVWSTITTSDLEATGAASAHSEGIIDLLSQAETADIAFVLKEAGPALTKLSVRTRPGGVDATVLTGAFGGGGHARAAGASIALPVAEAAPAVLDVSRRLLSPTPG